MRVKEYAMKVEETAEKAVKDNLTVQQTAELIKNTIFVNANCCTKKFHRQFYLDVYDAIYQKLSK